MKRLISHRIIVLACILMLPLAAFAQLPSPTYGWNLGNTLEPPTGEGTWGPAATQTLINTVAGSTPCASRARGTATLTSLRM